MIFYFDVGSTCILVVNDDWAELMQGTARQISVGAWMMAERLASLDFHARLQAKFCNDQWLAQTSSSGMRFFKFARQMLDGYASGFGSHLADYDCENPFFELAESVEKDIPELIKAMSDHLGDKNFDRFEARLCESSQYLFQAMVIAIGYCDAAGRPLASTAPNLWAELSRYDLDKLWVELANTCRHGHATWEDCVSAFDLVPMTKVWLDFLETLGLRYQAEGDAIVAHYVPLSTPVLH